MNRGGRIFLLVGVFIVLTLFVIFLLPHGAFLPSREGQKGSRPLPLLNLALDVKYIGDEECAVCHEKIYRSFAETGMGRSFYRPSPYNLVEDFSEPIEIFDKRTGFHYEVARVDSNLFQVEYRVNEQGERIHELKRKVDYIVGSGRGTRSYITEGNGFLYELPVTWYSQRGIWDLSPGYHTTNLRFSRPIVPECIHCHNSFTGYVDYSENRYGEVPLGIGCERCHGPGELHVEWRLSKESDHYPGRDSTILNPARLPLELQMDVCLQCHLQGEISVFKPGKTSTSFRPGMRLSEVKSVFIRAGLPTGDFRIASHGARISLSSCFTQTGGKLVCTTCHNPHVSVTNVARPVFNETCIGCHEVKTLSPVTVKADHRAGGDCVACHMRQGTTSDILHVNFTDHWIRKEIESLTQNQTNSMLAMEPSVLLDLKAFFDESGPEGDIGLGIAYVKFFEARHGHLDYLMRAVDLLEKGLKHDGESEDSHYYLGTAYLHQGRLKAARKEFRKAVDLAPGNAFAHFQLGTARYRLGNLKGAEKAFKNAVAISPDNPKMWKKLGDTYLALLRLEEAEKAYNRAIGIQPSFAAAHNAVGELQAYHFHDVQKARSHFDKAVLLEPDFASALHNLGNVHLLDGEDDRALGIFQRVVNLDPRFAPAHGSLASLYEKRGERGKALFHLGILLAIQPGNKDAQAMLQRLQ